MKTYRVAVIPGDGIGTEVIVAGLEVLAALAARYSGFAVQATHFDWGAERYLSEGAMMPADGLAQLKPFDAIYFGSAGDPRVPDHVTLWGLRLAICQPFDQYANVRPARILPGVTSPLSGVERVQRFALELARSRPRKHLTLVTKSNAQRHGMVMWDAVFESIRGDYPDVTIDKMLVDAMTVRMVLNPKSLDTIVATNLHPDVLSDLAAALTGSMGLAPTANLNPERAFPSMFEPIHGNAFDIMGQCIANPIGSFWSAAMMLEHLGEARAAAVLMTAIEQVTGAGQVRPRDLGGEATTREVTDAVIAAIEGANI